jgi:threonyl-tRNA synthetase
VPSGTTPFDIANAISPRLAAASVVARLTPLDATANRAGNADGESAEAAMYAAEDSTAPRLVDLSTPLTADTRLELLTEKDPEALKVVRHSAAHVMATAVLELFPETKLGHGPATDAGFFYDFYRPTNFTPEDLAAIEAKMKRSGRARRKVRARLRAAREGSRRFRSRRRFHEDPLRDQVHRAGSEVSFYRNGSFVDFCRGPHVPSTGRVKAFKVMSISGAYWLGDEKNPQLQRIYGTAFFRRRIPGRTLRAPGRGSQARPSPAGQAARPVQHSGDWPVPASSSGTPRAALSARSWKTGCATSASAAATRWSSRPM